MVRRTDGFIKALKRMATTFDLRHHFFLRFFSRSASAFRAPPLPEIKLLTRPIAHAAIGTLRDPLDR